MVKRKESKPLIESIINTIALALTAYGVQQITTGNLTGYISVSFGLGIEFIKYYGRNKEYW